jgi:hypothetical protein
VSGLSEVEQEMTPPIIEERTHGDG